VLIVAVPTIEERGEAWKEVAEAWYDCTPDEAIVCVPSWRKGSWAAGLNEVWEEHPRPEVFVCGSDDMIPTPGWYEACKPYLHKACIAPQVHDPRFSRWTDEEDGTETRMSSFPILAGKFLHHVFPIEQFWCPEHQQLEDLHYFSDDLISDRLRAVGIPTVAVPSCVINHRMDERGRGAGMGDESTRMAHDKRIYQRVLGGS
jgi:hypothetical protein